MSDMYGNGMIKKTSVPLDGGGDTHIHVYGPNPNDFVVTTRLPNDVTVHDKPKI